MKDDSVTSRLHELLDTSGIDYASEQRDPTTYPIKQAERATTHWTIGDASYSVTETFDADGNTATMRLGMLWPYAISPEQILSASLGGDVQLMLAQLGARKAKAHPWGYEPDTGGFDTTRCECGELNDISARFCSRCGREITLDMSTKELWDDTCRRYRTCEVMRDGSLRCIRDGHIYRTTDEPRDEICNVILDGEWSPDGEDDTEYVCDKCGYVMDDQYAWDSYQAGYERKPFDHCPGCGRTIHDMHTDPSLDPEHVTDTHRRKNAS